MQKFIKYLLSTIIALIILAALCVGILVLTVNPNKFKGPILQQAEKATGRSITINGDIKWSFYPWLGLNVSGVNIANPQDFEDKPFATLNQADIKLKLIPILSGKFELGKLVLNGLALNLIVHPDGKNNWDDLGKSTDTNSSPDTSTSGAHKALAFTLSGIALSDAKINFDDLKHQQHYALANVNLQSQNVSLKHEFPLTLSLNFNSSKPELSGNLQFNSKVQIKQDAHTLTLNGAQITTTLQGKSFPNHQLTLELHTNAEIDYQQQTLSVSDLSGKFENLPFNATLAGKDMLTHPDFSGSLTLPSFNAQQWAKQAGINLPAMRDPKALSNVSLVTRFSLNYKNINLSQLKTNIDTSSITGNISIQNTKIANKHFVLAVDQINLANYLSPKTSQKPVAATPGEAAAAATTIIPVATLKKLNLAGELTIGKLSIDQFQLGNYKLSINAAHGAINIQDSAAVFQGKYQGKTILNVKNNTPQINVTQNINNIQLAPLYALVSPNSRIQLSGTASLSATLHAVGADKASLTKTLNGKVNLNVKDGVLKGIDLQHQLDVAAALINKRVPPSKTSDNQTPFKSLTGTFPINNGVVTNKDLSLQADSLTANGSGEINLVQKTIDYQIKCSAIEGKVDPEILKIQQLAGGSIPIKVSGTFENYKVRPDTAVIIKSVATHYLGKNTDKIKEQIKSLGDKLKGQFNSLFN